MINEPSYRKLKVQLICQAIKLLTISTATGAKKKKKQPTTKLECV